MIFTSGNPLVIDCYNLYHWANPTLGASAPCQPASVQLQSSSTEICPCKSGQSTLLREHSGDCVATRDSLAHSPERSAAHSENDGADRGGCPTRTNHTRTKRTEKSRTAAAADDAQWTLLGERWRASAGWRSGARCVIQHGPLPWRYWRASHPIHICSGGGSGSSSTRVL